MSKYDSIKTAAEMVQEVRMHGLSTAQEDLNRIADIFGNTQIEELDRLANDIGRNNEHGEPDPKGSWSSNRQPTQGTFYYVISHIWNWEEVTRFWNLHTNPEHEMLAGMKGDIKLLESQLENSKAEVKAEHEARLAETSEKLKAQAEIDRLNGELHSKDMEIMELKARLYDLLVGKEGK